MAVKTVGELIVDIRSDLIKLDDIINCELSTYADKEHTHRIVGGIIIKAESLLHDHNPDSLNAEIRDIIEYAEYIAEICDM